MKRAVFTMLVSCFCLMLASCGGSSNKDKIVGKWEASESKGGMDMKATMEFKSDGKMTIKMGPATIDGKYSFPKDDVIKMEIEGMPGESSKEAKVSFSGNDEVTLTDVKGDEKTVMKRVK